MTNKVTRTDVSHSFPTERERLFVTFTHTHHTTA
jgi:hypothetical protein